MKPVRTVARTLLSAAFVINGARTLNNPEPFVERATRVTDPLTPTLEKAGITTDTASLVRINAGVQLVGGLLLATGHLPRLAATALVGSLVPTTLAGHPFWQENDPQQKTQDQIHFVKNLGMVGGLLLAALDTEGKPGLRWRAGHRVRHSRKGMQRAVRSARRDARIAKVSASTARRLPG